MNRKEAAELLPIIQAFSEGMVIEFSSITDVSKAWREVTDFPIGMIKNFKFRIKPEPKYRPFANAEECLEEMLKHQPFGLIKCEEGCFNIVYVTDEYVGLADPDGSSISLASKNSYQDNTFSDCSQFGIKVDEGPLHIITPLVLGDDSRIKRIVKLITCWFNLEC